MNNKEMIEKHDISKKTGVSILLQMIIMTGALIISLFGVFTSLKDPNRLVVYGGQAAICLATIVLGVCCFGKKEVKHLKKLVLAYALLEAIRVSLLQTGEIPGVYSVPARFILALLAVNAALLSERFEKKEGLYLSISMVVFEILLYAVFIIGFPAVRTHVLYMILPLVGVLMAASMCVFVKGRRE